MTRIETRTQLIEFIWGDIKSPAIALACLNGTVQVLGGFSKIPPSPRPGWIVSITSVHEHTWFIAVTAHDHLHRFNAWVTETIPWEFYVGREDREEYSIYDGDDPCQACLAKEKMK